jgi:hypothetical protein
METALYERAAWFLMPATARPSHVAQRISATLNEIVLFGPGSKVSSRTMNLAP